ncbi:MAG: hypothetical protein RIT03_532 [Bacteroidota bacterium]|jgi:hypothetical protein
MQVYKLILQPKFSLYFFFNNCVFFFQNEILTEIHLNSFSQKRLQLIKNHLINCKLLESTF